MKRVLFLMLSLALISEATAEQLDRYPNGRVGLPPNIMICPDAESVDLQVETIKGNPEKGMLMTHCQVTEQDQSAHMFFYRTGTSSKYFYDVLELKLWKKRPDGLADIYLGTYFTVGSYAERPPEVQTGELQLSPEN